MLFDSMGKSRGPRNISVVVPDTQIGISRLCVLFDYKYLLNENVLKIFDLNKKGRKDCIIRNTGDWHFNCDVYGGGQDINGKLNEKYL